MTKNASTCPKYVLKDYRGVGGRTRLPDRPISLLLTPQRSKSHICYIQLISASGEKYAKCNICESYGRLTHIGNLWQNRHRFINLWQNCHRFSSVNSSSQKLLFSGPDFVLIESAALQLPIVHTLTIYLSRKLSFQQEFQRNMSFICQNISEIL